MITLPCCMAQRSLHTITKVYYRSTSCFATVLRTKWSPLAVLRFPAQKCPLLHHVVQAVHKVCHKVWCHPHSTEHETKPIAFLISKQAIPYWTCGGTYYPRVSIPKISSLADPSMTNHITRRNPTISTILTLLKPQHRSSPQSNHISTDGRPSLIKTQAKLNITKDEKTCTTLMIAWLSITNQVWTQILKHEP
jgi:hypothetical protein